MNMVTDASVGIKWFKFSDEVNVGLALRLRQYKLEKKIDILVPDLFLFEVFNTLITNTIFNKYELNNVLNTIFLMDICIINPDKAMLKNAIDVSLESKLSYYDALYISIAQSVNAVLVTEDNKIISLQKKYDFIKSLTELTSFLGM
jgi:predicted nucleic acid-binding protein